MKKLVRQSTWLRKELQDGGLRQLIERIDAASDDEGEDACNSNTISSSGQMRQRNNTTANTTISARELALARTKHSHPKFASFVDRMLLTAGVLQPSEDRGGGDGIVSSSTLEGHGPLVLAPVPRRSGEVDANSYKMGSESGSEDESESHEDSDGSDGDEGSDRSGSDEDSNDSSAEGQQK